MESYPWESREKLTVENPWEVDPWETCGKNPWEISRGKSVGS